MSALLLFVLLTALPIPPPLDPLAGALRHQQNQAVVTAFDQAAQAGAPAPSDKPWFSLTRNRAGTLRFFLLIAAALGAATLSASLPVRGKIAFMHFLVMCGVTIGIAGWIGQWKIPQGDTLWWFIPIPHSVTSPVGCFLNRNHFGGFVAILCPIALAIISHEFSRKRWIIAPFYALILAVMGMCVALSLSRGALLAMGAGLVASTLVITFRHRKAWGVLLFACMVAGGLLLFSQTTVVRERFSGIQNPTGINSVQSRLAEWRESLRVWPHYPIIGAGMNALRMVYPQYRQTSVGARLIHAENEYVQLLAEGGLVGVGLAVALILTARSRIRETTEPIPGVIIIAVTGALTVTGVHCLFDFPAHLPLYALVMGSIAGLLLPTGPGILIKNGRVLLALPSLIGFIGATLILVNHPRDLKNQDDPEYLYTANYRELHQALVRAPTSSAWLYLGRAMYKEGATRGDYTLCAEGETFMSQAALLDPQNYRLWYELGHTRLALKRNDSATEAFRRAQQLRSWLSVPPIPGSP